MTVMIIVYKMVVLHIRMLLSNFYLNR